MSSEVRQTPGWKPSSPGQWAPPPPRHVCGVPPDSRRSAAARGRGASAKHSLPVFSAWRETQTNWNTFWEEHQTSWWEGQRWLEKRSLGWNFRTSRWSGVKDETNYFRYQWCKKDSVTCPGTSRRKSAFGKWKPQRGRFLGKLKIIITPFPVSRTALIPLNTRAKWGAAWSIRWGFSLKDV